MNLVPDKPIRLLVVDDHNLFRRGLVALLSHDSRFAVVGEAADASAAHISTRKLQPDLILLDNNLPGVQGVDAIAGLKEVAPQVRIVMLTVSENEEDLSAGLRAGADGYLLKTIDTEVLCDTLQKVWDGDTVISPEMMGKLVGLLRHTPTTVPLTPIPQASASVAVTGATGLVKPPLSADDAFHSLSPREREILALIARGDSNKLIARELDIAETTVKIHVQKILRKLNLSNRVHAAVYAIERGLGGG